MNTLLLALCVLLISVLFEFAERREHRRHRERVRRIHRMYDRRQIAYRAEIAFWKEEMRRRR